MEKYPQFPFYIVPCELAEQGKPTKAILYGLIVSLANERGECYATNRFLAEKLYLKNPENISRYLTELEKEGWIRRKFTNGKRIIEINWRSFNPETQQKNN